MVLEREGDGVRYYRRTQRLFFNPEKHTMKKNISSAEENFQCHKGVNLEKILVLPSRYFSTSEKINLQELPELKKDLIEINKIIKEGNNKIIEHILLERKRLILDRIQEISSFNKIKNLQDMVDQLSDGEAKKNLTKELNALREGAEKYQQEVQDITASETEVKIKLEQHRIDGLERKSKIWLSFLQRESAASIIGGMVLLMVTVALIGGMIFGAESQILSNGFLVILGYFFGQSSSKNKDGM